MGGTVLLRWQRSKGALQLGFNGCWQHDQVKQMGASVTAQQGAAVA
jgi:hypothetical protein